jgi:TrmH family RNA methyltransferase
MLHISSRQNPAVARYRAVAQGEEHSLVLLDGAHLVASALAARVPIRQAIVAAGAHEDPEIARLVRQILREGVEIVSASAPVMNAISPVRSPSAIVAIADRPAVLPDRLYPDRPLPLVVVAADVQDPGNVGAIVRVAEAGSATGVIAAGQSADPFGWKALRGSMGSALRLPIAAESSLEDAIATARSHGCRIVASAPRNGEPLFEADLTGALAILIGGEGPGLPLGIVADADAVVTIPMQPPVESLNAAVTAALIVYEARRQRQAGDAIE